MKSSIGWKLSFEAVHRMELLAKIDMAIFHRMEVPSDGSSIGWKFHRMELLPQIVDFVTKLFDFGPK
jgi:hypothetical protein